jgi:hypothetical protein
MSEEARERVLSSLQEELEEREEGGGPLSRPQRMRSKRFKKDKRVYLLHEGNKDMKMVLGGKGANLCEMARLGLPVPPGEEH